MTFTFEQTKHGYGNLWDKAKLTHPLDAKKQAERIIALKSRFQAVEKLTMVPWFMVGVMLYRESNLDMNTYLGNGQSLNRVTTITPAGRGPFQSFEQGALDAIRLQGMMSLDWTLELMLYWLERFNGQGYFGKGNSPYLWSWTDQYSKGKFTADGIYDPNFVDPQGGCAAILKALFEIDSTLMLPRIAKETTPMPDPVPTPTPTPVPATVPKLDLHNIASVLETVLGFLPTVSMFLPQLRVIVPFIPLIKGAIEMAADLQDKGHDPTAIVDVIVKHLGDIKSQLETLKQQTDTQKSTGG